MRATILRLFSWLLNVLFGWRLVSRLSGPTLRINGDQRSPPTKWYNRLSVARSWRRVAVIRVVDLTNMNVHIAFRDFRGRCMIRSETVNGCCAVRIGREDCDFFAYEDSRGHHARRIELVTLLDIEELPRRFPGITLV